MPTAIVTAGMITRLTASNTAGTIIMETMAAIAATDS